MNNVPKVHLFEYEGKPLPVVVVDDNDPTGQHWPADQGELLQLSAEHVAEALGLGSLVVKPAATAQVLVLEIPGRGKRNRTATRRIILMYNGVVIFQNFPRIVHPDAYGPKVRELVRESLVLAEANRAKELADGSREEGEGESPTTTEAETEVENA